MYFHESSPVRPGLGDPPVALPKVVKVTFRAEKGTETDPENCCKACISFGPGEHGTGITRIPVRTRLSLGVGRSGTASNGMELQFTLRGHRAGVKYDIDRKRRHSIWQRRGGLWTKLDLSASEVGDDHRNDDECLEPAKERIFSFDAPGYPFTALPKPDGMRWPTSNSRVSSDADATDVVFRATFAEWVVARNQESDPWKIISPGPFTFWHSIVWLTRDANNNWVLGPCSKIALGAISPAALDLAPVCKLPSERDRAVEEEASRWTEELMQSLRKASRWPARPPRPVPFEF
jgi:hypothetical protein